MNFQSGSRQESPNRHIDGWDAFTTGQETGVKVKRKLTGKNINSLDDGDELEPDDGSLDVERHDD